ncbi:hypothetical protein MTP04_32780 [Lysinibacillus sp. PLM2]|nr:hypothetical protein MTP04_32780 [Lysinibacillus sp. PLM2]
MTRHTAKTVKIKEVKFTQLLLINALCFTIVITLLNSLSIEPNLLDFQFYLLFLLVLSFIYKPFGLFIIKGLKRTFLFTKRLFVKNKKYLFIEEIDQLDGKEFKHFLKAVFEKEGYRTEFTQSSLDYGADLILTKGRKKYVVQAKRRNSTVGIKAIQEIVASVKQYNATGAIVVTNHYFTSSAKRLAKSNNVQLIDRDTLTNLLNGSNKKYRLATALSLILNK